MKIKKTPKTLQTPSQFIILYKCKHIYSFAEHIEL